MARGGKRPGAGRPKGSKEKQTLDKEAAREVVRDRVKERLLPMVDAQIDNAIGLKYLVVRNIKTGKFEKLTEEMMKAVLDGKDTEREAIEVWEKDPSVQAFTDLMNRTIDTPAKPAEEVKANVKLEIAWKSSE